MMQIALLRHGRPAFELKGNARAKDLCAIARSYDLSGIVGAPPRETVAAIQGEPLVVCSHLTRSIESAKALGFSEIHVKGPLFCETTIPCFDSGSVPLPVGLWVVVLRIMWLFGFSKNGESLVKARRRARQAAERLSELAEQHRNILLVGHGFINYFIAKELKKIGWIGPSKPGKGYWGYGVYERGAI